MTLRVKNKVFRKGGWVTEQSHDSKSNFNDHPYKIYHNVDIYRNLHKDCWSIKDRETGRVCGYETSLTVMGAKFIVGKKSRERVLREKRKNVHAYIRAGDAFPNPKITDWHSKWIQDVTLQVKYDPYVTDHFFIDEAHKLVDSTTANYGFHRNKSEKTAIYEARFVYLNPEMKCSIPDGTEAKYFFYKNLPERRR